MNEIDAEGLQRSDDKMEKLVDTVKGKFIKKMEVPWRDFYNQPHISLHDAPIFDYWNGKGRVIFPKKLYSEQEFNQFVNLLKAQVQKDCPGDYDVSVNPRWSKVDDPSWYPSCNNYGYGVEIINLNWSSVQAELDRRKQEWNKECEQRRQARKAKADQRREAENQARAEGRVVLRDLLKMLRNSKYNKHAKIYDYFGDSKGYKSLPLYYSDTGKLCFPKKYYTEKEVEDAMEFLNTNGKGEFDAYVEQEDAYIAGLHTYGWIAYIKKV